MPSKKQVNKGLIIAAVIAAAVYVWNRFRSAQ